MIDTLLSYLAPHLCFGCGQTGTLMCDSCKEDITSEGSERCIVCERQTGRYLCNSHKQTIPYGWYVARRTDVLQRLIDAYKFENTQAAYRPLADLLLLRLPPLPNNVVIVPIPTVSAHIRQRGYDHMLLVGRYLAKRSGHCLSPLLRRATHMTQREADRRQRELQASRAFRVCGEVDPKAIYLVIDDVATTGATLRYAAAALRDAGATTVWVAAIARQPLD